MIKLETITQLEGFGNDIPKSQGEHYRSVGMSRRMTGLSASAVVEPFFTTLDFSLMGNVIGSAFGNGRGIVDDIFGYNFLYSQDSNGYIYDASISYTSDSSTLNPFAVAYRNLNTAGRGIIVDQKGRLLYPQLRYLGMYDPALTTNYKTGTVTVTNGSANVVGAGTTFTSAMATNKRKFRIAGENVFYTVTTFTDATHIVLDRPYEGNTGALKSYIILQAWTDEWKDLGSNLNATSDNKTAYCDMDTYEDTVLIARNNVLMTLNTTTDTLATSAFTLPSQFDILTVKSGINGILLGCNFRNKGVLILWDNYSDRAIAPWLYLNESILGCAKSGDGWIVQTTKNIYYTNGYSLQLLASDYLDTSIESTELFGAVFTPNQLTVTGENIFMQISRPTTGRKRAGLYRFNIASKLFDYYTPSDMTMYGIQIYSLFYANDRLLVGYYTAHNTRNAIGILNEKKSPRVASLITLPIGVGNDYKLAEGSRMNMGVNSLLNDTAINQKSFTVSLKVGPVERQLNHYAVVKTTTTDKLSLIVDGTVYAGTSKGDEVEFLNGDNAGYTRHVSDITGQGTSTETWTLDSELPSDIIAGLTVNISPFRLVDRLYFNSFRDMPEVYFNAKKAFKAQQFMLKVEIIDATFPVELRQWDWLYDDMGIIE